MNTAMATAHWRRATRALSAANRWAIGGEYEDAISMAYYSMMHAAKAALATKGIAAKSHSAVQRLFSEHLIRSREIERERASDLGTARQSRTTADYDAWTEATEEEAHDECKRAMRFLTEIRQYLRTNGLREENL